MIWTEKYRPTNLKDYIGSKDIIRVASNWMKSWEERKVFFRILIFHGRSGTGKTTLAMCLANEFNCAVSERNASDERNVKQMKRIIQGTGISGLDLSKRLTILDEADNISSKAQKLLVDKQHLIRQPIILLVNDMDKIIPELKNISLKIELKKPTLQNKLLLAREVIEKERLEPWDLRPIIEKSESYRDVLNNLFFDVHGVDFSNDTEGTKLELVGAMLRGEVSSERLRIAPDELLRYVYQNKIHSIMRDVDVYLTIADRTQNYRMWAYSFSLLELQRFRGTINAPKNEFKRRERSVGRPTVKEVEGKSKKLQQKDTQPKRARASKSLFNYVG